MEVVEDCPTAIESATDTLTETPKSPKISSDEDFINKPKIGNISATGEREITARRKHNGRQGASRGSGNGATRETCSTKSSMLQTNSIEREMSEKSNKSDAKDSQVEEILTDGKDDLKEILDSQISRKSEAGNDKVVVLEICDVPEKSQSDVLQKQLSDQISCENTADNAGDQRPPVLWTECFRPGLSGEILGNNSGGSMLKKWLSEWKYVREKKLNEMKRLQKKKLKK